MAQAEPNAITRRTLVAAAGASLSTVAAALPIPLPQAHVTLPDPDRIYSVIAAHERAYAAYAAQLKTDSEDDEAMEPLCDAEQRAADALAATVPATLEGAVAALAYVRLLNERDDHPLLDDFGCYTLIASVETALRHTLDRGR